LAFDERSSRLRHVPFDALLRARAAFLQNAFAAGSSGACSCGKIGADDARDV